MGNLVDIHRRKVATVSELSFRQAALKAKAWQASLKKKYGSLDGFGINGSAVDIVDRGDSCSITFYDLREKVTIPQIKRVHYLINFETHTVRGPFTLKAAKLEKTPSEQLVKRKS